MLDKIKTKKFISYYFIYKILENSNNLGLPREGGRVKEEQEREYKEAGGNFRDNECLHYLDCGDCFMGVQICQNLSN